MKTVSEIYEQINSFAPFDTCAEWDNVGLLVGDKNTYVTKTVIGLDITSEETALAEKVGAQLIISHHPVIFKAQKNFLSGSIPYELARAGISAICAHTSFDKAIGGVNDVLCDVLEMSHKKLPENAGEGFINVGTVTNISTATELARYISKKLKASVRFCDAGKKIDLIGVCSGAGGDLAVEASVFGCNAFITGDASYHEFLDAEAAGVSLFAAGHFETEQPAVYALRDKLVSAFDDIEFIVSERKTPIQTVTEHFG